MVEEAIAASEVTKRFGRTFALKGVSFSIPKGSVFCVAGPNGSGKTTLLNILSASLAQDSGSVEVHGSAGYCRQVPLLYPDLSISQNLTLFSEMFSVKNNSVKKAVAMLGLSESLANLASEVSAGTKKKAELAIAILSDPDILLFDEPTTGLDKKSSGELIVFIKSVAGKKTLVIATHSLFELEGIATHLLVLKNGEKAYEGRVKPGSLEKAYKKIIK